MTAVQFTDNHCAPTAEVHDSRLQDVCSEIDKSPHGAFAAHGLRDHKFGEAVLQRYHHAIGGEVRQKLPGSGLCVQRLGAQKDNLPDANKVVRRTNAQRLRESFDWASDGQTALADSLYVIAVSVHGTEVNP